MRVIEQQQQKILAGSYSDRKLDHFVYSLTRCVCVFEAIVQYVFNLLEKKFFSFFFTQTKHFFLLLLPDA